MDNEELKQIIREVIRQELDQMVGGDRFVFRKNIQIENGVNIRLSPQSGTKIGTATTQKIGFWDVTPVDQPATVTDPSGGATVDSQARSAIVALIDRLQETGLIASS
jgi:hypothetical protein